MTQDSTHRGFSWEALVPLQVNTWEAMLYYLLRFLNNISISQKSTAVQRCARKSTEFASG